MYTNEKSCKIGNDIIGLDEKMLLLQQSSRCSFSDTHTVIFMSQVGNDVDDSHLHKDMNAPTMSLIIIIIYCKSHEKIRLSVVSTEAFFPLVHPSCKPTS